MKTDFKTNDIIMLPKSILQSNSIDFAKNLFRIVAINNETITLKMHSVISFEVKLKDILPVPINGIDDKSIYYKDGNSMATYVFDPQTEVPPHYTDYTYYMEQFKAYRYNSKSLYDIINELGLKYVHQVQHYLKDEMIGGELKFEY